MSDTGDDKIRSARAGARQLIAQAPKMFAGLVALCGVAYLAGSFYTRAYFSEFGASWVLEEVPAATYYSQSWVPLLLMLYIGYLATTNLARAENTHDPTTHAGSNVSQVFVRYGLWSLLILLSVIPLWSVLGYGVLAIGCSILGIVLLLLLLSSAVELVMVPRSTTGLTLDRSLVYLSFAVIAVGLYVIPTQLGINWARIDKLPTSSLLPVYVHSEGEREYRLLLSIGERLYIFPVKFEGSHPPVHATVVADVSFTRPVQ